ncbi:DUF1810 domain-containing protein [Piscinibacter sp.]|uniref:DUF1810 domain-containing protein n=1 Tax=Piscinibacter sp. TaxID=1903157 RepID=UPI00338F5445
MPRKEDAMDDPHALQRFVDAQQGVYAQALSELRAGAKASHWMWFVFPQLRGLGHSAMAQHYGLAGLAEAQAYWRHPLLGPRLAECTAAMLAVPGRSARQILGTPDDLKLRSCMTLFMQAVPGEPMFRQSIERWFDGTPDPLTLARLAG